MGRERGSTPTPSVGPDSRQPEEHERAGDISLFRHECASEGEDSIMQSMLMSLAPIANLQSGRTDAHEFGSSMGHTGSTPQDAAPSTALPLSGAVSQGATETRCTKRSKWAPDRAVGATRAQAWVAMQPSQLAVVLQGLPIVNILMVRSARLVLLALRLFACMPGAVR